MRYIDSHTHAHLRGYEDLELMGLAGIGGLVVCAWVPVRPSSAATLLDLFGWLADDGATRLAKLGLKTKLALGVHPRCIPETGLDAVLERLPALFERKVAAALGEVGLETGAPEERDVLARQLAIARDCRVPVVVHTPRARKVEVLAELVPLLKASKIDLSRVVVDHLTPDLVPQVRALGAVAGVTVQPGKVTADGVAEIVRANGANGIVVNSDLSPVASDPLAVARVARHLRQAGIAPADAEKVTYGNAAALFGFE